VQCCAAVVNERGRIKRLTVVEISGKCAMVNEVVNRDYRPNTCLLERTDFHRRIRLCDAPCINTVTPALDLTLNQVNNFKLFADLKRCMIGLI
jgi:hypothetical protein